MFEVHLYVPLLDVWMEVNVKSTEVYKPTVSGGDTIISVPLSGQGFPVGSIHVTVGTLSLITVQVRVKESPATGMVSEADMVTMFCSADY